MLIWLFDIGILWIMCGCLFFLWFICVKLGGGLVVVYLLCRLCRLLVCGA